MKRLLSMFVCLLLAAAMIPGAMASELAEYKDDIYSFRYPASWKRGTAKDGTITLRVPGVDDGVLTFGITTDILQLTGDAKQDDAYIQQYLSSNGGKFGSHLKLDGSYESITQNGLPGFRAFGKVDGKQKAHLVVLTGQSSMVIFAFVGMKAIAEEEAVLSTVNVTGRINATEEGGLKRWKGGQFSLLYPQDCSTMEQATGVIFLDKAKKNTIAARTYQLSAEFSPDQALSTAKDKLPKSTKVIADPVMTRVGDWDAAVITGDTKAGPMAFYVIGSGRTALALMFLGKEALQHVEAVISSVTFK